MRAALIGCGAMGQMHARALMSIPEIELVALADVDPTRLNFVGDLVGVPPASRYDGFQPLFESEQLDLAVVATQAPQHAAATLAAAAHGVHVLCEKPLALDLNEADRMLAACQNANVRLAVNHLRRLAPAAMHARDMIKTGEIGEVLAVDIHDKGGRPAGNTLMEMATHYFDMARFLLSSSLADSDRPGDHLEWVYAHLSTGHGSLAHPAKEGEILNSQEAVPADRDCGPVLGERGTILLGFAGEVQAVARFHNRPHVDAHLDGIDVIGTKGSLALREAGDARLFQRSGYAWSQHDRWRPVRTSSDSHAPTYADLSCEMLRELVAAVAENREHVCSGRDGLAVLEAIMAVYESHRRGTAIALPLAERRHPLSRWLEEQRSTYSM